MPCVYFSCDVLYAVCRSFGAGEKGTIFGIFILKINAVGGGKVAAFFRFVGFITTTLNIDVFSNQPHR